jgi:hypothetical protein
MTQSKAAGTQARTRDWKPKFLAALAETGIICHAARTAGIGESTPYSARENDPAFARAWDAAIEGKKYRRGVSITAVAKTPAEPPRPASEARTAHWRALFFDALVETSNVSAAAARAKVPTRTVYKLRREDRDFAAKWQAALAEGYDNLEMEVVGYLRDPAPTRKMDVTAALRLLSAHRDTVERRRALTAEEDEKATLESLDAFFEGLKQRRLANEQALREAGNDNDDGDQ